MCLHKNSSALMSHGSVKNLTPDMLGLLIMVHIISEVARQLDCRDYELEIS